MIPQPFWRETMSQRATAHFDLIVVILGFNIFYVQVEIATSDATNSHNGLQCNTEVVPLVPMEVNWIATKL
jgi:hypothetical protein